MLAVAVLVLVVLDVVHQGALSRLDHDISRQIQDWDLRNSAAKPVIYAFTLFGQRGTALGVSATIVAYLCWRDRSPRVAAVYVVALIAIAVVVYGFKYATERTAPPVDAVHVASGASFPSGHLVNATVLWWLVAVCAARLRIEQWLSQALTVLAWVGPVAVIASMTLLDYHWLSDFVGALCVSVALRYLLIQLIDRVVPARPFAGR